MKIIKVLLLPWEWIKGLFGFIFFLGKDTINDFKTLKKIADKVSDGKPLMDQQTEKEFKEIMIGYAKNPFKLIQDNWLLYILMAASMTVGWFVASQYYQMQCNDFIINNFLNDTITNIGVREYLDLPYNKSILLNFTR